MVELTVSVEVADPPLVRVTPVGFSEAVSPEGETVAESVMVPVKPERLVRVIVETVVEPPGTVAEVGLAVMLKFGGLGGVSLMNLTFAGAVVPSAYSRSIVGLVPVGLRAMTWLSDAESSQLI